MKHLFSLGLILLFISGCSTVLPSSFTIDFYKDTSSPASDRILDVTLIFKEGILTSGILTYKLNLPTPTSCVFDKKTMSWVNNGTNEACPINPNIPLTKEGLQKEIDSGNIVLMKDKRTCADNGLICYTLID